MLLFSCDISSHIFILPSPYTLCPRGLFTDTPVVLQAALSNTGIPKVNVIAADPKSVNDQPEVDVSDEEFLQFNTSSVPVIITLTKVPHLPFPMTHKT